MILSKALHYSRALVSRPVTISQLKNALNSKLIVRHGGGRRLLRAKAKHDSGFLPLLWRYFLVGAIPGLLLISYCNVFIGNAVLYDHDREVFEPEYWEYYKHPIERFLAKYVMEDPKLSYYKDIYMIETAQRDERQVRLVKQVEHLQKMEQEGMIAWQMKPSMPRSELDILDEYYEKNLKDMPKD